MSLPLVVQLNLPLQTNSYDCGLYVCLYARLLLQFTNVRIVQFCILTLVTISWQEGEQWTRGHMSSELKKKELSGNKL